MLAASTLSWLNKPHLGLSSANSDPRQLLIAKSTLSWLKKARLRLARTQNPTTARREHFELADQTSLGFSANSDPWQLHTACREHFELADQTSLGISAVLQYKKPTLDRTIPSHYNKFNIEEDKLSLYQILS